MKEIARLAPLVAARAEATTLGGEVVELHELAADSSDAEMQQLAEAELAEAEARLAVLREELTMLVVPPEECDAAPGAVVEIRPGAGGQEAGLFASELFDMYAQLARRRRWRWEVHERVELDQGGTREATASITGEGAYAALKAENGVHRVQRIPATESLGRVHTSTAVVLILPTAAEGGPEVEVLESDVKVDVFRASGAGGQHVNTTESAVRLTHIPTGIKVSCQDERSQHNNKASAMKSLQKRVAAHAAAEERAARDELKASNASTGARNERIRTYNFADDRVTDHRLGASKFGMPRESLAPAHPPAPRHHCHPPTPLAECRRQA